MNQATPAISRRQLLIGDIGGASIPIRPPWASPEAEFLQHCTRCNNCLNVCDEGILIQGSGGYPEVSFDLGGCSYCGKCMEACEPYALKAPFPAPSLAWRLNVSIRPDCLSMNGIVCRACTDACETDAIHFRLQTGGRSVPAINDDLCNSCGFCKAVCPSHSVEIHPVADH